MPVNSQALNHIVFLVRYSRSWIF